MPKRLHFLVTVWAIFALLLSGCGDNEAVVPSESPLTTGVVVTTTTTMAMTEATLTETDSVATKEVVEDTSTTMALSSSSVSTADTTESKSAGSMTTTTQKPATSANPSITTTTTRRTKESAVTQRTSVTQTTATTAEKTTAKTSASTTVSTGKTATTTTATTTTTTAATTTTALTTSATIDPNRVTINGKEFAVGDIVNYTVMVKTVKNYGTVKIGIRCLQKGLEIPDGTFQKQNQYVMKNIGIGRFGTTPEDTVGTNGFSMTAQKGYALDAAYDGYAGLLWYYETTDYDWGSMSSRNIDCSKGIALFTIAFKITKPGEYMVECMEYPSKTRADLTVWGEFS